MILNEILTWEKIQLCTHNQSLDIEVLKADCYCILCSLTVRHVKIKIKKKQPKNCITSLIICCFITLNEILTCGKSELYKHNKSGDMDILKSDCSCIMCSIALMHIKIKI